MYDNKIKKFLWEPETFPNLNLLPRQRNKVPLLRCWTKHFYVSLADQSNTKSQFFLLLQFLFNSLSKIISFVEALFLTKSVFQFPPKLFPRQKLLFPLESSPSRSDEWSCGCVFNTSFCTLHTLSSAN